MTVFLHRRLIGLYVFAVCEPSDGSLIMASPIYLTAGIESNASARFDINSFRFLVNGADSMF